MKRALGPSSSVSPVEAPVGRDKVSNLAAWLEHHAALRPEAPSLRYKARGLYHTLSWQELATRVKGAARGLELLGFAPGSLLLSLGELTPAWLTFVLAAHRLGGTVLALAHDALDEELSIAVSFTRPRFALAEGARELEKFASLRNGFASDARFLFVEPRGVNLAQMSGLRSIEAVERAGAAQRSDQAGIDEPLAPAFIAFEKRADAQRERRAFYHGALHNDAQHAGLTLGPDDELWLDPSLRFSVERLVGLTAWLESGARLGLGESLDTLEVDRRELGPSHVVAAGTWYESLWQSADQRLPRKGSQARTVIDWALSAGADRARRRSVRRGFARVFLLNALREVLGLSRVELALIAHDAPSPDVQRLFDAIDVTLRGFGEGLALDAASERAQLTQSGDYAVPGIALAQGDEFTP